MTLLPAPTKDAPIECTLSIGSLNDQNLHYEALSYEWGDPDSPKHEILLDGQPFIIRRNLWQALRCLRTEISARTLWVDAICINQEDVSERNHQVGMMGSIYSFASSVRVWLGEKGDGSREAILLLHEIWESFGEVSRFSVDLNEKAAALREKILAQLTEPASPTSETGFEENRAREMERVIARSLLGELSRDPVAILVQDRRAAWWRRLYSEPVGPWEAVAALMERTYWSRIWIVQEYLLATSIVVQCGWDYIDGKRFDEAVTRITELVDLKNGTYSVLPSLPSSIQRCLERIYDGPGTKISKRRVSDRTSDVERTLLELMETCKSCKSCDPHDRIYAILGLAGDVAPEAILVDYERSIFKVKMDVAWFYQSRLKSNPASVSRVCSLLDEIFADYEDDD